MKRYRIVRFSKTEKEIFGHLLDDKNNCLAWTLEDYPSKIPLGTYQCNPHNGAKYKNVWEITNVPGHSAILIHQGNTRKDTEGCVLVGSAAGHVDSYPAVLNSRHTLQYLRETLPMMFELSIEQPEDWEKIVA